jgi:molecular chaperone DnaJ
VAPFPDSGALVSQRDYYEILGVGKDSSDSEIKSAYRKLAMKYHPDRNKEEGASDKFKEATEAYSVLSDGEKRARYDRFGHAGVSGGPGGGGGVNVDFGSIFEQFGDIFGGRGGGGGRGGSIFESLFGGGGGRGRSQGNPGRSLRASVDIDMHDVLNGTERTITLRRPENCGSCKGSGSAPGGKRETCTTCQGQGAVHQQQGFFAVQTACPRCHGEGTLISKPCGSCRGSGQEVKEREISVKIPAGIDDGAQIRLTGQGEAGRQGGPDGDLFVEVRVADEPRFHRDGSDLYTEIPVSWAQAVLGDKLVVETLEGEARMTMPAGTATGKLFRIRGQGLPRLHGGSRGDLLVRVFVDVPTKLTREEKSLVKKMLELDRKRDKKTEKKS